MKTALCGVLAVAVASMTYASAFADAVFDAEVLAAQAQVVAQFPDAGKIGTTFHTQFKMEYDRAKLFERALFDKTDWPLMLARRTAETVSRLGLEASGISEKRSSDSRAGELPPRLQMPEQEIDEASLAQANQAAKWAETFRGSIAVLRDQHEAEIARAAAMNKVTQLKRARALAAEFTRLTGKNVQLAENAPAELAAQINGLEQAIENIRYEFTLQYLSSARIAEEQHRQPAQTVTPNTYGPGMNSDEFGRPHNYRTKSGEAVSPIFQGDVKRDAYGMGVHSDQFGRPVYDSRP